ncbi:MAG: hypothetical protein ABII88_04470 [Candidatus Omnitrophota bacterium]
MRVSVVDVKEIIFEDDVESVILPGRDGELGVLDLHEAFLYRLKKGVLKINNSLSLPVEDGVAKMQNNRLVILVER